MPIRANRGISINVPRHADKLIPTRASLLARLKDWKDQSSWQEFFDIYWKLVFGVARRAGLTEVEAQDVVQETMFAVAKHMPTFKYNPAIGSFKAWLLDLTRWRIIDQFRKRGPLGTHRPLSRRRPATSGTDTVGKIVDPAGPDLDKLWEEDWQSNLLAAALANVKRRVAPQTYQLFDFYVNKDWTPENVAVTFGVPVDHVYTAKHRVTEMIRGEVKRLEAEVT